MIGQIHNCRLRNNRVLVSVCEMLRDAHDDLLAFTGFPAPHWKKIWSTNPLERLNKEFKKTIFMVTHDPHASERATVQRKLDKGALV